MIIALLLALGVALVLLRLAMGDAQTYKDLYEAEKARGDRMVKFISERQLRSDVPVFRIYNGGKKS